MKNAANVTRHGRKLAQRKSTWLKPYCRKTAKQLRQYRIFAVVVQPNHKSKPKNESHRHWWYFQNLVDTCNFCYPPINVPLQLEPSRTNHNAGFQKVRNLIFLAMPNKNKIEVEKVIGLIDKQQEIQRGKIIKDTEMEVIRVLKNLKDEIKKTNQWRSISRAYRAA